MISKNKDVVVKSNRLVEASYRLTLVEQQLILFAICKARDTETLITPTTVLTIDAKEFAVQFNANATKVYGQLKDAADTLFERRVIINDKDEKTGKPRRVKTRWVQDVGYVDGAGQVQLAFARKMIPYITRLSTEFTKYRLEKVGNLTSAHAVRLYELLLQRLNMTPPPPIEIQWLKDALELSGEYERTDNFKRAVLDVAVKQINKFTDLKVSYTQKKTGRVITHFAFDIKMKPEHKPQPKKKGMTAGDLAAAARPGEHRDDAFHRVRGERAKRKSARSPQRPEQMTLPECLAEPIPRKPDDPAVKELIKATRAATAALKRRAADKVD